MSLKLTVDTSVAIKFFVPESDSLQASTLMRFDLHAPSLMRIECNNVLWRLANNGRISTGHAEQAMVLLTSGPIQFHACEPLEQDALRIALELQHPVYDCYYLALNLRERMHLVTEDRRLIDVARRDAAFRDRVLTLAEAAALAA